MAKRKKRKPCSTKWLEQVGGEAVSRGGVELVDAGEGQTSGEDFFWRPHLRPGCVVYNLHRSLLKLGICCLSSMYDLDSL